MIPKEKFPDLLVEAKKPILIVGNGCRNRELIEKFNMPTFLTWGAMDVLPDNHPLNLRDFGITSNRAANFILKEADLIIALGTRLDTHEVMGDWRTGKLVSIDIDESEIHPDADMKICLDANSLEDSFATYSWPDWLKKCKEVLTWHKQDTIPYRFIDELSKEAKENAVIITDAGQTLTWTMQSWKVKEGQRLFSAFNHSPMGYAVPASIGAAFARPNEQIIAITGDGGFQMNIQELQTIRGYSLPIKIFVLDNNGYGMIKQTIADWPKFLEKGVACEPYMAKLQNVAKCYGLKYVNIENTSDFWKIPIALEETEPTLIRVSIPEFSKIKPKLKFGDEMTDLTPKLTQDEKTKIKEALQ